MSIIIRNRKPVDPLLKELSKSTGCTIETIRLNVKRLLPIVEELYGKRAVERILKNL